MENTNAQEIFCLQSLIDHCISYRRLPAILFGGDDNSVDFRPYQKKLWFYVNSNLINNLIIHKFLGAKKGPLGAPGLS